MAGLIGVGKSTLTRELGRLLEVRTYYEPVDENPYLADFYADMRAYAFHMQMYLLNKRSRQQLQIDQQPWSGCVQDRSIYEDRIFARMLHEDGLLSKRDYDTYVALYATVLRLLPQPTLIVMLDVPPRVALERIQARGLECEKSITLGYLEKLAAGYERFVAEINIPVLRIDYSTFLSAETVAIAIEKKCAQRRGEQK
jgi:deoxyadenosine kinase